MTQHLCLVPRRLGANVVRSVSAIVRQHGGGAWLQPMPEGYSVCVPGRWNAEDRRALEQAVRECCNQHEQAAQ